MHNGFIADFHVLRRDLMLAIDPDQFADVQGSTDTEVVFHLALTLGLESDPIGALERTVGLIEATAASTASPHPCKARSASRTGPACGRCATRPRGRRARSSRRPTRTPSSSLYPENPRLQRLSEGDRLIVSEPFSDLPGLWHEIPEATAVSVRRGGALEERPFVPRVDASAPAAAR